MKDPHLYHSYYDYSGHHYYSSSWNNIIQRLTGENLSGDELIRKVVESNLEYLQIKKNIDIRDKFSKIIPQHHMDTIKAKIDFLNNLKMDDNTYAQSVTA